MGKLANKVVLITGGSSGIGLASAKLFKQEGAKVFITASTDASYARAQSEYGKEFTVLKADVSKMDEIEALFAKTGKIDVLFANAGIAQFRPTEAVEEALYDQMMNVNVKGLYFTVAKALPYLNDGSSVVLTASSISVKGMAGASVYAATKAAVRSFARSWTAEIPVSKARFNVLSPGPTETPIFDKTGMSQQEMEGFKAHVIPTVPAKRMATSDEMAKAALFLASDDSSYVLGTELFVDGGISQI